MTDRYSRQASLVPEDAIKEHSATVIGVGAIGRQVALQLAAIGIPRLELIDFDTVEESNIASQGYFEADLGRLKVQATGGLCGMINSDLEASGINARFARDTSVGTCVFCCVDSIDTRQLIWDTLRLQDVFFTDGRMSGEVCRILTAADPDSRLHYPTTLFPAAEAQEGSCTAKSTIYSANIAAGLMVAQFTKHLRGLPVDADIQFNLLTTEITVD